jgi:hypothetical protein
MDAPLKIADLAEGGVESAESHGLGSRIDLIACRDAAANDGHGGMQPPPKGGGKPVLGAAENRVSRPRGVSLGSRSLDKHRSAGGREGNFRSKIARCGAVRVTANCRRLTPPARGSEPAAIFPERRLCRVIARLWKLLRVLELN